MASPTPVSFARPYRDFLTPSLHTRFTNAALLTLGLCYVEAIWMGQWSLLWQWFPLGWAGLRTLLLFISILAIYVLRVAQMHVGPRTSRSQFDTFRQHCFRLETAQTLLWYSFSAWLFCEVYIWSASPDSKLAMVDPGRSYERPRLNERPIYLRTMFLTLAVAQSAIHLYKDYDEISLPPPNLKIDPQKGHDPQPVTSALRQLQRRLPLIAQKSLWRMGLMAFLSPIVYALFLRRTAWKWTFAVARMIFSLPKTSKPSTLPSYLADLIGRFCLNGFLLMFLWEFANTTFDLFVAQEPLKKGHPLTDDSTDPNGSLLAGLKARKELPRTSAFRELLLIAYHHPMRRVTLYKELDRAGSSTWSQLVIVCLGEIHAVIKRIQDAQGPPTSNTSPKNAQQQLQTLPKIASGLKADKIFSPPPPPNNRYIAVESNIGSFAKSHGQSPGANPISPRAKKLLTYGTNAVLSEEHRQQLSLASLSGRLQALILAVVRSPVGIPVRQTFRRQAVNVILGSPRGSLSTIIDAIRAITKLSVLSLKEDSFGRVQSDVANIIRTFVSTITSIESFIRGMPVHWSDVDFREDEGQRRKVPEVEEILAVLRTCLKDLINEFGEYADNLGLTLADMRRAKEAVAASTGK